MPPITTSAAIMTSASIYVSGDGGRHWHAQGDSGWEIRTVALAPGKLFVTTAYDGILKQTEAPSASATLVSSAGGASQ